MSKISAIIIAYNEASNIGRCIDSIRPVSDEVIVIDSGSEDNTEEICREKGVLFKKRKFTNFADQKNYGNSFARYDYILSIDSDECLSQKLTQSLLAIKKDMKHGGYTMNRISSYAGKWIKACGWYPDTKLRVWKKGNGKWVGSGVHEQLHLGYDKSTIHLKGDILHYAYSNVSQFLEKIQRYSSIYASDQRLETASSTFKILYKTIFTFVKNYFFQRGILYGYRGLLISICNANHVFYKYSKLQEANRQLSVSLVVCTYNREDALEASLMSAMDQSHLPDEIIVADDGSGEKTKNLVEIYRTKTSIPIQHCWHADRGFRAATIRNKAIAMAKNEYIILIDGDIIMHRYFVQSHKINTKKNRILQGSRVLLSERITKQLLTSKKKKIPIFDIKSNNPFNAIYSPFLSKVFSSRNKNLMRVRSANMSFWKRDLMRVNGFNENFVGWGREDSELIARMNNAGMICIRLKFMGFGYHLYHDKRSRSNLIKNNLIMKSTVHNKLSRCENGIDKYTLISKSTPLPCS